MKKEVLDQKTIAAYQQDGVVCLRGFLTPDFVRLIEEGIETALKSQSMLGWFMSTGVKDYNQDLFMWLRLPQFWDILYQSPLAPAAAQLMQSDEVNFFYDQMFVKRPGANAPTPWHNDLSFWPVAGEQLVSFWCPVDPVTKESSGLQYVRGSHKTKKLYQALSPDYNAYMKNSDLAPVPDIDADPDAFDLVNWDMKPGDVLAFHPLTLHGSSGNKSRTTGRRAAAFRFVGDDVRYSPGPARMPILYHHGIKPGQPLNGNYFPRVFPAADKSQLRWRESGAKQIAVDLAAAAGWQNMSAWVKDALQKIKVGS